MTRRARGRVGDPPVAWAISNATRSLPQDRHTMLEEREASVHGLVNMALMQLELAGLIDSGPGGCDGGCRAALSTPAAGARAWPPTLRHDCSQRSHRAAGRARLHDIRIGAQLLLTRPSWTSLPRAALALVVTNDRVAPPGACAPHCECITLRSKWSCFPTVRAQELDIARR